MEWEPREYDLRWTENLLKMMSDHGASWVVPMSASVFYINKNRKEYELITGDILNDCNQQLMKVLSMLGYKCSNDKN
jgi:hypothetical protein